MVLSGQTRLWGIQAIGFLDLKRREEHYVLGQPNDTDLYRFELNGRDLNPIGGQPARLISQVGRGVLAFY